MKKTVIVFVVGISLLEPCSSWAFQDHPALEGLYVHQMAHMVFSWAMAMLAYWLERNGLTKKKGWRLIQVSCVAFVAWNACAFAGHWVAEMAPDGIIVGTSDWNKRMVVNGNRLVMALYLLKLDNLVCVPAVAFLFLGIRSLHKEASKQEHPTNE